MKKLLLSLFAFSSLALSAQDLAPTAPKDSTDWVTGGIASLTFSQSSFSNWAAGGDNNINLSSSLSVYANKKWGKNVWENNLDLGYGTQKLNADDYRKSDDRIDLNSKFGSRINDKLNYSFLLNFRSQFTDGFAYTDTSTELVSGFLAPSFTLLSIGIDYRPSENLTIYYSPLTEKITTLFNDSLSSIGAFGVDTGKRVRFETGSLLSIKYQKAFKNNVYLKSKLDMFMGYADMQAIDVNWENTLSFNITKLFAALITTNLIYDQDILIDKDVETSPGVFIVESKARTQFKQIFSLGISYKF